MNILRERTDNLSLDKGVEAAEKFALRLKKVLVWILVALFASAVGIMVIQVLWRPFTGEPLTPAQIVATLGTFMVLTLVADGFKIVNQDLKEGRSVSTVLKMAMVGVIGNIFFNMRRLGDPDMIEFIQGFAAFALILAVSALSYFIIERSLQD